MMTPNRVSDLIALVGESREISKITLAKSELEEYNRSAFGSSTQRIVLRGVSQLRDDKEPWRPSMGQTVAIDGSTAIPPGTAVVEFADKSSAAYAL